MDRLHLVYPFISWWTLGGFHYEGFLRPLRAYLCFLRAQLRNLWAQDVTLSLCWQTEGGRGKGLGIQLANSYQEQGFQDSLHLGPPLAPPQESCFLPKPGASKLNAQGCRVIFQGECEFHSLPFLQSR